MLIEKGATTMTQAISKIEREQTLSQEDIELVKKTVAAGASESEFKLFLYIAQRYNLDPLVKQIWLIKYGTQPAAIFTSRDGFLSVAHRSGQFDGMETQAVRGDKDQVVGAICRVWRRDMTHPFTVEVSRSEYDTGKGNWQKMPETMIKKVAESQCLRRAFDISGLYDMAEYDPTDNYHPQSQETLIQPSQPVKTATVPSPVPTPDYTSKPAVTAVHSEVSDAPATDQQKEAILKMAGRKGVDDIQLNDRLTQLYGVPIGDLTRNDAAHFIKVFQGQA